MPKAQSEKKTSKTSAKVAKSSAKAPKRVTTPSKTESIQKPAPKLSTKERANKLTAFLGNKFRQPKYYIPAIVIVILILLYIFRSAFVVALVNGQPVTRAEYNKMLEAQAGKQVMNALVTEKLVEQEAARQHVSVSQSELDAQVKNIQDQLAKQGQTLDTALAAQGMTKDDFVTQLKLQTLVKKMLGSKISVSDKEVTDYINQNKDSLPTGESEDQLKTQVKQQLEQQKLSQQAQALVQKLQQQAHITYFTNY